MVKKRLNCKLSASLRRRGEDGFTLVEMLVVITIIALIMSVVGPGPQLSFGIQGQGHADPIREFCERTRPLFSRYRAISIESQGLTRCWNAAGPWPVAGVVRT